MTRVVAPGSRQSPPNPRPDLHFLLTKRILLILLAAVLAALALAPAALADLRTLLVQLPDSSASEVQVDLPAGSPAPAEVEVPEYEVPLAVLEDRGPVPSPAVPGPVIAPDVEPEPPAVDAPRRSGRERERPDGARPDRVERRSPPVRRRSRAVDRRKDAPAPSPSREAVAPEVPAGAAIGAGAAEIAGVPNFVIRRFKVPIFLLPIYQAAGIQYGVRWEVLAAINEIETDYGRNLRVSSAGAVGWMQFLPSTWQLYGVDANRDGRRDPYNPVDAIFSAARYLRAAGAQRDLRAAVWAYNHADWYVDDVLARAREVAGMPPDLVGSLTGLTEGRFPVYARARYAGSRSASTRAGKVPAGGNAARVVEDDEDRQGIEIYSRFGAPTVAVSDGVIKKIGSSPRWGRYVVLQDAYGNRYTYAGLGSVARFHPVPRADAARDRLETDVMAARARPRSDAVPSASREARPAAVAIKSRLFAHPRRPRAHQAGGLEQVVRSRRALNGHKLYRTRGAPPLELDSRLFRLRPLRRGSRVIGGTQLGRLGTRDAAKAPHLYFEIRPAGLRSPRIDPAPILEGWRLLESTAVYRATGRSALHGEEDASIGQILLLPKPLLERRVLADERIELYSCGRRDVQSGQVDRRVLATLAFLAESGMNPTVSSLKCGHGFYTASGNVSHHSSGNAVDIAALNGVPVLGNQERGGPTERAVKLLMGLQGTLAADQIISLLDLGANTLAMDDHADHIHVGFSPLYGSNRALGRQARSVLQPGQWDELVERLGSIDNPRVPLAPSRFALPAAGDR